MQAADVAAKTFTPTKFREGYAQEDVDDFLDRVQAAFAAHEQGRVSVELSPEDVTNARFRPTRFRNGYDQDEVDDFLDRVVVALRALGTGSR